MRTTAAEIQCAAYAGLRLVGDKDGRPQYMGTAWQWSLYENNLAWVKEHGTYMWEEITKPL